MSADHDPHETSRAARAEAVNARFAGVQQWGVRGSIALIAASFLLYASGALPARVALESLPGRIAVPVDAYVRGTGMPVGWGLLGHLERGDLLALLALLAPVATIAAAYAALVPLLLRQREWIYLALVLLQLAVFALAASGGLGAGGH